MNVLAEDGLRKIGIVTLPGFNEIDSFLAARIIGTVPGLSVELVGPQRTAVSAAGIEVYTPGGWASLPAYAAVLFGSGARTFEHIENAAMMTAIQSGMEAAPAPPLIGSQCSGAAILHRLGLIEGMSVCTDRSTAPRLQSVGVEVIIEPFRREGRVATAGGCLSAVYLAFWVVEELAGRDAAELALLKVAPVGEEAEYQTRITRLFPTR